MDALILLFIGAILLVVAINIIMLIITYPGFVLMSVVVIALIFAGPIGWGILAILWVLSNRRP